MEAVKELELKVGARASRRSWKPRMSSWVRN